ncbi:unnamed protein product [Orchesella dallaii]|uniref:G-protein coupled receptors family 1 profile domain-containing protein n=1 Tax=Orchesella dallaii TaxID=48710 RepID=A0ABP1Q5F6_9HEXA
MIFAIILSCFSYLYLNYIDKNTFDVYAAAVLHFTPFVVVLVLNVFIVIGMHKNKAVRKSLRRSLRKSESSRSEEDSITIMLLAVIIVFGFCYSFEFVRRIMNYAWSEYMSKWTHYDYAINHLADIFYVLNSSINFLIYCLFGSKFRSVFLKMFRSPFVKRENVALADSHVSRSNHELSAVAMRTRINSGN